MNTKFLNYKFKFIDQNIDIKKLRPNKSYDYLIKNRNQSLTRLLKSKKKLKKFLIPRDCPSCKSKKKIKVCTKDSLNIVKCKNCELVYVSPIFNYDHYINLYTNKEYQNIVKKIGEASHKYRKKRFGVERFKILKEFFKKRKCNLLEIGCSTGFFLEEAKSNGWNVKGIELNPSAVSFAKKKGIDVINEDYVKIIFKKKFDIICAFDVLEHLFDPLKIIKKIKKDLKKNGLFFLYVPNWQSATRLLIGEKNSHFIWPTHHLTYFTPKTLEKFLAKQGFKVIFWETQGLDLEDINWYLSHKKKNNNILKKFSSKLQFMINSSGYGKNLRMLVKKI